MNYLFFAIAFIITAALLFITDKFFISKKSIIYKILSLLLVVAFFIRYFAKNQSLFQKCIGLNYNLPFQSRFLSVAVLLAVWLSFASVVIMQMLPFFPQRLLKTYAKVFCLIANLLSVILLPYIVYTFTSSYQLTLCGAFFGIEIGIALAYSINLWFDPHDKLTKKDWLHLLYALPLVLLFAMPPYVLRTFFGTVGLGQVKDLGICHRLYIYLTFIFLFGIYLILHKKGREFSRMALLYISLTTMITFMYDYDFSIFTHPTTWPLHLCNTAMFIIPLCLIFKWDKLFYFTLFINVLGAFFAILMPNYTATGGALATDVVNFWINHIMAFAMPVLIILLDIYERPNLRFFTYSMVGFLIYFTLMLIINAWFTNYKSNINFFFLNTDFIVDKLGKWAKNTRNYTVGFKINDLSFVFYPVYQSLFFVVYVALGFAMWYLYLGVFHIQDFYLDLEQKRTKIKQDSLALCVKYQKKELYECMNKESENKLVVNQVSKRYGNNKFYSVRDVSFTVNGGEILGFLGPNGAGKSTIIKCIVGIQPPTSGSIEINGWDIEKQPVNAKAEFGFVPDHYALYEKLTGREYINYMADLYGVPEDVRNERLEGLITQLQMQNNIDNQIRTYSHGMKQKITIMSALIHEPKLWILDEPLTGLDPDSIFQVKECMKAHAQKGNIVFFSSHIIDIVEKLCDRIIIIKKGQIMTTITTKELQKRKINLEKFYLDIINDNQKQGSADMTYTAPANEVKDDANTSRFFRTKTPKPKRNKTRAQ